jgi:hypothetical protein
MRQSVMARIIDLKMRRLISDAVVCGVGVGAAGIGV